MSRGDFNRLPSPDFCRVDRRKDGKSRTYIVHSQAPRFVAEIEAAGNDCGGVIRRVVVPNSWSGDYHHAGGMLGAALAFFESTDTACGGEPA